MNQTERKRILYIERPSDIGGTITGLYETIRSLDKNRYEPIMLFHGPNPYREQFQAMGVKVIVLSEVKPQPSVLSTRDIAKSLSRYGKWLGVGYKTAKEAYLMARKDRPVAQRVAGIIRSEKIDLIHHNNHLAANKATVLAGKLAGVPQVVHVRMLTKFGPLERLLARFVNKFIYMSTAIEQCYRDLGIPASQGQVIYDTFDLTMFDQMNHTKELRAEFGITDQDCLISNVGRLDWWKGQDFFLEAIGQLMPAQANVKALLVGTPDDTAESQAHHKKLHKLVEDLHLQDNVIFAGFRSDVPQIMAASDIVLHSASEPEPFGRVVVEAMASSRPVIATAAGGVLDIVKDGVTGLLVPPKDVNAMADAIRALSQDSQRAMDMGRQGRLDVEVRFSVKQHVTAIQQVYDDIFLA